MTAPTTATMTLSDDDGDDGAKKTENKRCENHAKRCENGPKRVENDPKKAENDSKTTNAENISDVYLVRGHCRLTIATWCQHDPVLDPVLGENSRRESVHNSVPPQPAAVRRDPAVDDLEVFF